MGGSWPRGWGLRFLLDTHVYAWWVSDEFRLSRSVRELLSAPDAEPVISAVVPWELANKFRVGKWPTADAILRDLEAALREQRLMPLPISLDHARRAGLLAGEHRDPFDRMLAAQAQAEQIPVVTVDPAFARLGVPVIW